MNEQVWVFGNSDGAGVITSIGGEVIGIGGDKIEVDAKFVSGNSGSPVIDAHGDVIGIATYAEIHRNSRDWVKSDTRFNETRRYALTLGGVEWEPLAISSIVTIVGLCLVAWIRRWPLCLLQ